MTEIYVGKNREIKTLTAALERLESLEKQPAIIYLDSGIYKEKVKITADNLTIIGEDRLTTIITYDDYALKIHADGKEYNTFRTYTMMALGNNITLKNLTIENSAGEGPIVGQAVALSANGDGLLVENCALTAHQDTLFCAPLPLDLQERYIGFLPDDERNASRQSYQVFKDCLIRGDVDFIFGCAEAVFFNCEIYSNPHKSDTWISAPSTESFNRYGMSFVSCKLSGTAAEQSVYLARPWREYGNVNFFDCQIGKHIKDEGFSIWEGTVRHKNSRFFAAGLSRGGLPYSPRSDWTYLGQEETKQEILSKMNEFLSKREEKK